MVQKLDYGVHQWEFIYFIPKNIRKTHRKIMMFNETEEEEKKKSNCFEEKNMEQAGVKLLLRWAHH